MAKVLSLPHRSSLPWSAQSILELAPAPIAIWSADRSNCIFNDAARKITGFTERDFRDTRTLWIGRIQPEDQQSFLSFWNELEKTQTKLACDYRFLPKGRKKEIKMRDSSTSLRSVDGVIDTVISIYTDISDLTVDHNGGRTDEHGDPLIDLIRPFLHEVQNSLHVIRMGIDLMSMDPTTTVGLQSVTRGLESLDKLSNELHEYCFPKPAKAPSKQPQIPVKQLINCVQGELQHQGISVRMLDRTALPVVGVELLDFTRALKYIAKFCQLLLPPCGELEVEVGQDATAGHTYLLFRMDHGPLAANFDDQKAFHPFLRVHGIHVGLSMALARQIVRRLGGDIMLRKETQRVVVTILLEA